MAVFYIILGRSVIKMKLNDKYMRWLAASMAALVLAFGLACNGCPGGAVYEPSAPTGTLPSLPEGYDSLVGDFIGKDGSVEDYARDTLEFTAAFHTPTGTGEYDLCKIKFEVRTNDSGENCLYRDVEPVGQDISTEELALRVEGLNLRYWDGANWYDNWDSGDGVEPDGLPKKVEIKVTVKPEVSVPGVGPLPLKELTTVIRIPGA